MKHLVVILSAFIILGCSKDAAEIAAVCQDGKITWKGDPAANGFGWVFIPDTSSSQANTSSYYVLKQLDQVFQQDGLSVNACLDNTGEKAPCNCTDGPFYYRIVSIRKR